MLVNAKSTLTAKILGPLVFTADITIFNRIHWNLDRQCSWCLLPEEQMNHVISGDDIWLND